MSLTASHTHTRKGQGPARPRRTVFSKGDNGERSPSNKVVYLEWRSRTGDWKLFDLESPVGPNAQRGQAQPGVGGTNWPRRRWPTSRKKRRTGEGSGTTKMQTFGAAVRASIVAVSAAPAAGHGRCQSWRWNASSATFGAPPSWRSPPVS